MCVFVAGRCSPSPLLSYLLIPSYYCVLYSPHFVDADTLSALTWGRIYAFDEPQQSVSSSLCVPSGDNVPLTPHVLSTLSRCRGQRIDTYLETGRIWISIIENVSCHAITIKLQSAEYYTEYTPTLQTS